MAVTVGFEPTVGLHPHNFSRVAPSAARTRHRGEDYPSPEDTISERWYVETSGNDVPTDLGQDLSELVIENGV